MDSRLKLHEELCKILGSRNVYFQPPESIKLQYPCIVYSRSGIYKQNANNTMYRSMPRYTLTYIYRDPDSSLSVEIMARYPMCSFVRSYTADNLNHDVLDLYN